MTKVR